MFTNHLSLFSHISYLHAVATELLTEDNLPISFLKEIVIGLEGTDYIPDYFHVHRIITDLGLVLMTVN